jgi:hypothetical protein
MLSLGVPVKPSFHAKAISALELLIEKPPARGGLSIAVFVRLPLRPGVLPIIGMPVIAPVIGTPIMVSMPIMATVPIMVSVPTMPSVPIGLFDGDFGGWCCQGPHNWRPGK